MKNVGVMELCLASLEFHLDCSLEWKSVGVDFDEKVRPSLLRLLHPDIASSGLWEVGEPEHVHGPVVLRNVVQGQPHTDGLHGPERPVGAVLVPGNLQTLPGQLAEDPGGEQPQPRVVEELRGCGQSVGVAGQAWKYTESEQALHCPLSHSG